MGLLGSFIGGRPEQVPFVPVDTQASQLKTVTGNTAIIPQSIAQANALNLGNFDNIDRMLAQASGGVYSKLRDKALANTMDLLNGGDITDVLRGTAASNLTRGVAGTGFGRTTALQNSVTATQANKAAGFSSLERWLAGTNQIYQPISTGAMFARNSIGAEFGVQQDTQERNAKFQADYVESMWKFYDSPGQRFSRFEDEVEQIMGSLVGMAGGMGGGGGMCWVARSCFGENNPKWLLFRHWLLTQAPTWFVKLYRKFGERFAAWISDKPMVKNLIRGWMESRIATLKGAIHV